MKPNVTRALLIGAAQILWLNVPDHAAVDLAVRLVQADRKAERYAALVNAVLRRVGREGTERLTRIDATALNTPAWLLARWVATYGDETAHAIANANGLEPALDFTVKQDPAHWAQVFGGRVLPTGSVRANFTPRSCTTPNIGRATPANITASGCNGPRPP